MQSMRKTTSEATVRQAFSDNPTCDPYGVRRETQSELKNRIASLDI